MQNLDAIRADIRTAYDAIATGDEHTVIQYARAAHSAATEAALDPTQRDTALILAGMVVDLI